MRNKTTTILATAMGILTGLSLIACGGLNSTTQQQQECTFDSECSSDNTLLCDSLDGVCRTSCLTDDDCPIGELCFTRDNAEGFICAPDVDAGMNNTTPNLNNTPSNNTSGAQCTDNEQCGVEEFCNPDGFCEAFASGPSLFAVQILDTTSGVGCDRNDPGSDFSAALLRRNGNVLGYASQINISLGPEDNDFSSAAGLFDGSPPGVDTQLCPESFDDSTVVTVGCGGWLLVQFLDDNREPIALQAGDEIQVGEYDPRCSGNRPEDSYDVFLCTDGSEPQTGSDNSCTRTLGTNLQGLTTVTINSLD